MRIKKVAIKNFKRFTNLSISDIPESSKLVLLIGSNGSGKSSLFDAFDFLSRGTTKNLPFNNEFASEYYKKDKSKEIEINIELDESSVIEKKDYQILKGQHLVNHFIGRSSIRIVPRISNNANPDNVASDNDSPLTYIENDTRFTNDVFLYIQQINNALREPVFSGKQADTLKIFRDFIEPLNTSLIHIFGGDETTTIQIAEFQDATPGTTAKLIFRKGASKINYDLLSHGEKQVIILLLNFIVRKEYYENAIIFIDEMDCHLNTTLQSRLLHEIVSQWIPGNAQLWTASHALGFIDYARKSDVANIIDFDLLNFDLKQELLPLPKDKMDVYEIAIPKSTITSILSGYKLVVVENTNDEYYNAALGGEGYLFLPANNNREVFLTVKGDKDKTGLRDRDYLKDNEIEQLRSLYPKLKVLNLYTFENYIYHPDNIAELQLNDFDVEAYKLDIMQQKHEKLIDIVAEIKSSRNHYIEFKEGLKNDDNIKPITDALQSGDFDVFYTFFNMKKYYNKKYLSKFNIEVQQLATTEWFKQTIKDVLGN